MIEIQLDQADLAEVEAAAKQAKLMRRNDQDPRLRAFAQERAGHEFSGFYAEATERLLEQGIRGQAVMVALNKMRAAMSEGRGRPGKDRFIGTVHAANDQFNERRAKLDELLADSDQEDTEE